VALTRLVIVTGGQTGVDRAALDVAGELGIPYAGFCPRGGWAEDLPEPPGLLSRYPHLRETPLSDPAQRTAWNVRDSNAVLILVGGKGLSVSQGTRLANEIAAKAFSRLAESLRIPKAADLWILGVGTNRHGDRHGQTLFTGPA
jgi:Circularly permutated YpsA SLOG family